jgi:hypothetical protein
MFIRGHEHESQIWHRFHFAVEGFVVADRGGLFEARVVANASWVLDLFLALTERLRPRVAITLDDLRSGRRWRNPALLLSNARDAIIRLRPSLLAHGGVEFAVYDEDDQVTLTPHLELFIYGRTERWYYFLRDLGLRRYRTIEPRSWRLKPDEFPAAPALEHAIAECVERLTLESV